MNRFSPQTLCGVLAVCMIASSCLGVSPNPFVSSSPSRIAPSQLFDGFTEPFREIQISAPESGPIAKIHVTRGQAVQQGDHLVSLDTQVLDSQRKIALVKANSTTRVEALRIESELKQQRYEKLNDLLRDGAGSVEETNRAKADASVATLEVTAAEEELRLRKLELAEIDARIAQRQMKSPITGVVTEIVHEIGEYVSGQQPHVATVVQLDQLRVTFYVPTSLAQSLSSGNTVSLHFPESAKTCDAMVDYVGVVTEADSGRVRIDVSIQNDDGHYRSGVRCQLRL